MKKLTRLEIKKAILSHAAFRDLFPELKDDFAKLLQNPGCSCGIQIIDKTFKYKSRLAEYFKDVEIKSPQEEAEDSSQNNWNVINCHIDELETVLNSFHKVGRVQLAVARFEDQCTLIVNSLGIIF